MANHNPDASRARLHHSDPDRRVTSCKDCGRELHSDWLDGDEDRTGMWSGWGHEEIGRQRDGRVVTKRSPNCELEIPEGIGRVTPEDVAEMSGRTSNRRESFRSGNMGDFIPKDSTPPF